MKKHILLLIFIAVIADHVFAAASLESVTQTFVSTPTPAIEPEQEVRPNQNNTSKIQWESIIDEREKEQSTWRESTHYCMGWGTPPQTEIGSLDTVSVFSALNNAAGSGINSSQFLNNAFVRTINVLFIDLYISGLQSLGLTHDYFGHGSRALEFGIPVLGYASRFPKPGGDLITAQPQTFPSSSAEEIMLFHAGGVEGSQTTHYEIEKMLYSGKEVPYYYWCFDVFSAIDIVGNIQGGQTKNPRINPDDFAIGDVGNYLVGLTKKYGYYNNLQVNYPDFPDQNYSSDYINPFLLDSYDKVVSVSNMAFLNPSLIMGLAGMYGYISQGTQKYKPFMFNAGGLYFMPGTRVFLGTSGPETYLDMFMRYYDIPFSVYYRYGGDMLETINGEGAEIRGIQASSGLDLSIEADTWSGGGYNIEMGAEGRNHLFAKAGYKTEGPLISHRYSGGVSLSAGFYF